MIITFLALTFDPVNLLVKAKLVLKVKLWEFAVKTEMVFWVAFWPFPKLFASKEMV